MDVDNGPSSGGNPSASGKEHQTIFQNLKTWIEKSGGKVNSCLELRNRSPQDDNNDDNDKNAGIFKGDTIRGLFAADPIKKGEVLLRVPSALAISGEKLPHTFNKRGASPWLRCLACLCVAQDDPDFEPYISSLPSEYETLWQWNDEELAYLEGTTLGEILRADRIEGALQNRHKEYVQPYFKYLKIKPKDDLDQMEEFQRASMCISTRGFHMQSPENDAEVTKETKESSKQEKESEKKPAAKESSEKNLDYLGPFLLPMIDLLNHCDTQVATTLQRDQETGAFLMVAERDIEKGEEIMHSYGSKLNASQILQTFGFVPESTIRGAISKDVFGLVRNRTPAVLSKDALIDACNSVKISSYPKELKQTMAEHNIDGDVWELENVKGQERDLSFLPDQFLVTASTTCSCLSDEIVTICCIQFLPDYVYDEVFDEEPKLLDQGVLEDYFLGKLVVMAILTAVKKKLASYAPIQSIPGIENDVNDDKILLGRLLQLKSHSAGTFRAMYGLTIRLEEKIALEELRNEVVAVIACLDDDAEDDEEESDEMDASGPESSRSSQGPKKKQRMEDKS